MPNWCNNLTTGAAAECVCYARNKRSCRCQPLVPLTHELFPPCGCVQRAFTPVMHASEHRYWDIINAINDKIKEKKEKKARPNQVRTLLIWNTKKKKNTKWSFCSVTAALQSPRGETAVTRLLTAWKGFCPPNGFWEFNGSWATPTSTRLLTAWKGFCPPNGFWQSNCSWATANRFLPITANRFLPICHFSCCFGGLVDHGRSRRPSVSIGALHIARLLSILLSELLYYLQDFFIKLVYRPLRRQFFLHYIIGWPIMFQRLLSQFFCL